MGLGVGSDPIQHGRPPARLAKVALHPVNAARQRVNMGILEARYEHPIREIDDPGGRPDGPRDRRGSADGRDPLAVDRHRLRTRLAGVDGVDMAAGEDDIGGSFAHARDDCTPRASASRRPIARNGARRLH